MRRGTSGSPLVLHAGTDDEIVGRAVESLQAETASLRSVDGTAAALEVVESEAVACLVCESEVADGDGLDLLSAIAASDPSLPSLFLTADPTLGADALAAGATDIFVRRDGVDPLATLSRRLENVLAQRPSARSDADDASIALLHSMYDVTTDRESDFEEKVDRLLRLGCETFGLPNGFLTRIEGDEADGRQTIVQSRGPHEGLAPGESCPLSEAYCRKTIQSDGLLAFVDAVDAGWEDDPGYAAFGLESYIGGKVVVDGELYGTLCFASTEARETPFTDLERTAVRLMNEWVSYELGQRAARAELELKERAMDEAPVGILISDPDQPDNPAVYVNDQFTELTGYPKSAVIGRNCRFLQGDATREEPVDEMRDAVEANRSVSVELRNYRRDGEMFWNQVTIAPIEDGDGDIGHYVGFQEDITERKEQELELKLRNRAISAAPVGITIHDATAATGPITYANSAFERVTGYDSSAVEGRDLSVMAGEETDTDRLEKLDTAFESGQSASTVLVLQRADGSPFWARVNVAPVTDEEGSVTHAVGFMQDVTETKEHAETIERRLNEFGDVLAAELRTPLLEAAAALDDDPDAVTATDIATAADAIAQTDRLIEDLTEVHSFAVKSRTVFDTERSVLDDEP